MLDAELAVLCHCALRSALRMRMACLLPSELASIHECEEVLGTRREVRWHVRLPQFFSGCESCVE